LKVKVARVDLETIKIDFVMADSKGIKPSWSDERPANKGKSGAKRSGAKEASSGKKPASKGRTRKARD
jgi:ribonuclease R